MTRCRAALAAVLTALALATAACTTVGPSRNTVHGTVMSKSYESAYTQWHTVTKPRKTCPGPTRRLRKATRPVRACYPVPASTHRESHRVPACWDLHLSSGDHLCVTRTRWRRTRINDQV